MVGSWKTTLTGLLGLLTAIGALAKIAYDYLVNGLPPGSVEVMIAIGAITRSIGLMFARDDDVSSEEAGAK